MNFRITKRAISSFVLLVATAFSGSNGDFNLGPSVVLADDTVSKGPKGTFSGLAHNSNGVSQTISLIPFDSSNPFFQSLGTNGRSCGSCHKEASGWTITPNLVQAKFDATDGEDPLFRPVDGAVCPTADVSTDDAKRKAYSLLLNKALIRVSLPVPSGAEFSVVNIEDPYNCTTPNQLALFRRPLPSTNLTFLSTVMWDGRENAAGQTITQDLINQAKDATLGHAEAYQAPTESQLQSIVQFETAFYSAQVLLKDTGSLTRNGAQGGPTILSEQRFYLGINDALGGDPKRATFTPIVFNLFKAWENLSVSENQIMNNRLSIARGETIFNSRPINISGVAGLNDTLGKPVISGTCTTCHDTPNVGDHSLPLPVNIGIADASRRTPDLPLYTLQCNSTGVIYTTTDPGRAMITGKCSDIGKFKGPILRNLSSRPPYFHNGSAPTLLDVVNFYNIRFGLNFSDQDINDLLMFLESL